MCYNRDTTWNLRRFWLTAIGFLAAGGSFANADFVFDEPMNLGPAVNSSANEFAPSFSPDGLELYFARGGAVGNTWIARRGTPEEEWEPAVDIGAPINHADNAAEVLTADGLTLFLTGNRPGTYGTYDLWVAKRPTTDASWATPVNLGATVNSSSEEWGLSLSSDYLELYFTSNRPGGQGNFDLWMTTRASLADDWNIPDNLGPSVNTSAVDAFPSISADGLLLFFASTRSGASNMDLYVMRRKATGDPWGPPTNLGPRVNSSAIDNGPKLSADGSMLCFFSFRSGGFGAGDIWQIPITRIVDFNGDSQVDGSEVLRMTDCWGTDDPVCDIGPMPWGDGVVDLQDVIALAGYIGEDIEDPTLIARWALDETEGMTARDSVGDHDGTVIGDALWQPEGGMVDGALEFDGVDDFVDADLILDPEAGPLSILAWIKADAPGQVIVSQADARVGRLDRPGCSWLAIDPVLGTLTTDLVSPEPIPPAPGPTVTDGQWHRVGLAWDESSETSFLYVDEVEVAAHVQPILPKTYGGLRIGTGRGLEPGTFFAGLIDDVRIYNRAVKP